jgi:hypothetical protein
MNILKGSVWPIKQHHTRIVIPHNPENHWLLIVVDIPGRFIRCLDSLPGSDLGILYSFVKAQMERVGEKLGQDYSIWNPPINDVGIYFVIGNNWLTA